MITSRATSSRETSSRGEEKISQAREKKMFERRRRKSNFGNVDSRMAGNRVQVRVRRSLLRNNGIGEDEARFGLKVPRCVTRLLGAELMPPSEQINQQTRFVRSPPCEEMIRYVSWRRDGNSVHFIVDFN